MFTLVSEEEGRLGRFKFGQDENGDPEPPRNWDDLQ
jgi:hypothetical protein